MAAKTREERKAVLDEKIKKELEKLEKLKKERTKLDQHLTYRDVMKILKDQGMSPYDILEALNIPIPDPEDDQPAGDEESEN